MLLVVILVRKIRMFNVTELDAYYGNVQILRKVSLNVQEKELVTLIGANGAGKSTVLMSISGIIKKTSGVIDFQGTRIDHLLPHLIVRTGIIHVPQNRLIFPQMTVLENLEIGTRQVQDIKIKNMQQRLNEVFSIFKVLSERKNQNAGTLSGGEQQMLAIARGLMGSPKFFLLDEPSLGLAPIMVKALGQVISDLHSKGLSILLVEQNANLALKLASRGYVLQSGAIVANGISSELAQSEVVRKAYLGDV